MMNLKNHLQLPSQTSTKWMKTAATQSTTVRKDLMEILEEDSKGRREQSTWQLDSSILQPIV